MIIFYLDYYNNIDENLRGCFNLMVEIINNIN